MQPLVLLAALLATVLPEPSGMKPVSRALQFLTVPPGALAAPQGTGGADICSGADLR